MYASHRSASVSAAYYVTIAILFAPLFIAAAVAAAVVNSLFVFMNAFATNTSSGAHPVGTGAVVIIFVLPVLWLGVMVLAGMNASYVLTDEELEVKYDLFRKMSQRLPLTQVQNVTVRQSLWGRIVGYGDVIVQTAGATTPAPIRYVADPESWANDIHQRAKAVQVGGANRQQWA